MSTRRVAEPVGRAGRSILAVSALGTMLTLVAFTAPLSTLNSTAASLGSGAAGRTWILSSMGIGLGAALLSTGTISDDYGRRRTFAAGLGVLALGTFLAALAPSTLPFVLARLVQGVGGAAVVASSLGIIAATFPPGPERAAASGVWGASVGAGIAVGPLLAAGFDATVSWRDAFWVIGVTCLVVGGASLRVCHESRVEEHRPLDVVGALMLAGGVSALLAALVEGRQSWTATPVYLLALAAVLLLVGFVAVERRTAYPMLDLALFRHPPFVAATVAALATGCGVIALLSYFSGFVGLALGIPALAAAALLAIWSVTSVAAALLARRIPGVSGRGQLVLGLVGVAVGQLAMWGLSTGSGWLRFVPGLLVTGVASGVLNAALGREAVASVPPGRGSVGSGANNTARYVGSALGVTVVSVIAAGVTGPTGLVAGWNRAVLVTAGVSVAGALVVLAARARR